MPEALSSVTGESIAVRPGRRRRDIFERRFPGMIDALPAAGTQTLFRFFSVSAPHNSAQLHRLDALAGSKPAIRKRLELGRFFAHTYREQSQPQASANH